MKKAAWVVGGALVGWVVLGSLIAIVVGRIQYEMGVTSASGDPLLGLIALGSIAIGAWAGSRIADARSRSALPQPLHLAVSGTVRSPTSPASTPETRPAQEGAQPPKTHTAAASHARVEPAPGWELVEPPGSEGPEFLETTAPRDLPDQEFKGSKFVSTLEFDQHAEIHVSATCGMTVHAYTERWGHEGVARRLAAEEAVAFLAMVRTVRPDMWKRAVADDYDLKATEEDDEFDYYYDDEEPSAEPAADLPPLEKLSPSSMEYRFDLIYVSLERRAEWHDDIDPDDLAVAAVPTDEAVDRLFGDYPQEVRDSWAARLVRESDAWLLRKDVEAEALKLPSGSEPDESEVAEVTYVAYGDGTFSSGQLSGLVYGGDATFGLEVWSFQPGLGISASAADYTFSIDVTFGDYDLFGILVSIKERLPKLWRQIGSGSTTQSPVSESFFGSHEERFLAQWE